MISICVPCYNNLDYLKILYNSIKRNIRVNCEFIVHDNCSTDGTLEWLIKNNISYTKSDSNLGFSGVNNALKNAHRDYVAIFNSDMYILPYWDIEIIKQIKFFESKNIDKFTISSTLIEPIGNNPEYKISYHGHDCLSFNEQSLLSDYIHNRFSKYNQANTIQYSHPILMPKKMLEQTNYLDDSYWPGWSVDHDLAASAYKVGCRNFLMLGNIKVYHFISKGFTNLSQSDRIKDGQNIFLKKWGLSVEEFRKRINIRQNFRQIENNLF